MTLGGHDPSKEYDPRGSYSVQGRKLWSQSLQGSFLIHVT